VRSSTRRTPNGAEVERRKLVGIIIATDILVAFAKLQGEEATEEDEGE